MTHYGKAELQKRSSPIGGIAAVEKRMKHGLIKVGVMLGMGEHNKGDHGQTVAEIAMWAELGTETAPARPFLRPALVANLITYRVIMKTGLQKMLLGKMSVGKVEALLGVAATGHVQAKIVAIQSPPNSELTIQRKKSRNPLIDTGQLRQSISWATAGKLI